MQEKYQLLIVDLLVCAVWKKRVLPVVRANGGVEGLNGLKVYLAVYHEAVVCNMLEVMLYHYTAIK